MLLVVFGVLAGAVVSAIPPLVQEVRLFLEQLPHYLQQAQDHSSVIGKINERFHVQQRISDMIFGVVSHIVIVAVLTVYFLADMPRIRTTVYRLVPNSRRPRAILIGDEVVAKVGDYVFGNVVTSLIAGAATSVWCFMFDIPYPLLLGAFVAIVDLFPYGSTHAQHRYIRQGRSNARL